MVILFHKIHLGFVTNIGGSLAQRLGLVSASGWVSVLMHSRSILNSFQIVDLNLDDFGH
jgi:hypothetical protein